jgi:hypothetical protein
MSLFLLERDDERDVSASQFIVLFSQELEDVLGQGSINKKNLNCITTGMPNRYNNYAVF